MTEELFVICFLIFVIAVLCWQHHGQTKVIFDQAHELSKAKAMIKILQDLPGREGQSK